MNALKQKKKTQKLLLRSKAKRCSISKITQLVQQDKVFLRILTAENFPSSGLRN
jgi:hypothetical protein